VNLPKDIGEIETKLQAELDKSQKEIDDVKSKFQSDLDESRRRIEDLTLKLTDSNVQTMEYLKDVRETEKAMKLMENENSKLKGKIENMGMEQAEFQKKMEALESHQKTVDRVLELLDLKEEDAKVLSQIILDYRERNRLKGEAEAFESSQKDNDEILEKLREEG
jgi:chromosome segregation ATPase